MHLFIKGVEKHFKLTMTTDNKEKQEIKKLEALEALLWPRNENPTNLWKKLASLGLTYELTSPISNKEKKQWIQRNAPTGYNDTLKNAQANLSQANKDWNYVVTYEDMQNEINDKYESFQKASKKRAEISLLTAGDAGGGRGGGRG